MIDSTNVDEEQYLILNNQANKQNICEFEVDFVKQLSFKDPSECALVEINLPNDMKTDKFSIPRTRYFELKWIKNFDFNNYAESDNPDVFDKQTSDVFEDQIFEQKFGGFSTVDDLVFMFHEFPSHYHEVVNKFCLSRFANKVTVLGESLFKPKVIFQDEKFQNIPGKILFKGLLKSEKDKNPNKTLEELYAEDRTKFFTGVIAYLYFTFDEELHNLMGFDQNNFPNILIINDNLVQVNGGVATYKPKFDYFSVLYVYTDIVKESHVGNIKTNILKVFSRKFNSDQEQVTYTFSNLLFIPLRIHEINSIRIICADNYGIVPTYKTGEISLVLVVRPINK